MKTMIACVLGIIFSSNIFSQGQIQGFTVDPASPTTADFVKIYADVVFTSGGCALSSKGNSTVGNVSTGYAQHCLGMLTVICTITDTFNLGYLPAGPHVFRMTLSSGFGGPPCSMGFAPDDIDSVNFTVQLPSGIIEAEGGNVEIYPNPMHTTTNIKIDKKIKIDNAQLIITDIMGRTVRTIKSIQFNELQIERDELPTGMYFYQLIQEKKILSSGKLLIE